MRWMLWLVLVMLIAGCDVTGIDFSGIDDGDGGGWGGGGGGGGCCDTLGTIRPIATTDVVLTPGSAFQLQALDRQGNPMATLSGSFSSSDTAVITVSTQGWAAAVSPGSTVVQYREGEALIAITTFSVDTAPSTPQLRIEVHGRVQECGSLLPCTPAGSPIIDGWIGHTIDTRDVSLSFVGSGGLESTDQVAATPIPLALCQARDYCASLREASPSHAWIAGETTLCLGVTVGDSVPEQAYKVPNNHQWAITWSRPGLFILRQTIVVYVRPSLSSPAGAC